MIKKILLIVLIFSSISFAQNEIEVFIIDSYVTPKLPHKVMVSFFTNEMVKSKIKFEGNSFLIVSNDYQEDHKFELELSKLKYDSTSIAFVIETEDSSGRKEVSEEYDLYLNEEYNIPIKDKSYLNQMCLGAVTYLIPSIAITSNGNKLNYSLTKEFPIISFYNAGYNYPSSYVGIEYSYIFNVPARNYLRVGYKYIFQTKYIKYISPGINATTNFSGFNGISPEITFGLFKFDETFTFYARYRYNLKPSNFNENFSELSIGLFASAISFNF